MTMKDTSKSRGDSVPPELPSILKEFTKAAIRTQPYDLLRWSHAYFKCVAGGEVPPVKEWLEPKPKVEGSLTLGLLRVLHKQMKEPLSPTSSVSVSELESKWFDLCLKRDDLEMILDTLKADKAVIWLHFIVESIHIMKESFKWSVHSTLLVLMGDTNKGVSTESITIIIERLALRKGIKDVKDLVDLIETYGCQNEGLVSREDLDKDDFKNKLATRDK